MGWQGRRGRGGGVSVFTIEERLWGNLRKGVERVCVFLGKIAVCFAMGVV